MKRICAVILISFLTAAVSAQAPASSLLWEIRGKDLKGPSYLFGTFHMMCRTEFEISPILKEKIISSRQFYGEIAMDNMGAQMELARKMMMTDRTLSGMIAEPDRAKISERFQQIAGMPLQLFDQFKPFVALSLVTLNSIDCSDKVQPETEFASLAKKNNIPLLGLETIDDQVKTINSQPIDSQMSDLKKMLLNFDSTKQVMKQLRAVYQKRDIDSLYAFMKSGGDWNFENELLTKRNHNWIPLIEKAITDKPSFFAVGAGHLGGPNGVVALLRSRGYELTPVKY